MNKLTSSFASFSSLYSYFRLQKQINASPFQSSMSVCSFPSVQTAVSRQFEAIYGSKARYDQ